VAKKIEVVLHEVAVDGLPDMDDRNMVGRVAFIFDGCVVSGHPLRDDGDEGVLWEADDDVGRGGLFAGVTHWLEFPAPVWGLGKDGG